jgi:hypothetical protein
MRDGLKQRCITRDLKWGIPVPLDGYRDKVGVPACVLLQALYFEECLLHASTFATARVALPTVIEPGHIT